MLSLPENEIGRLINVDWDVSEEKMNFDAAITVLAEDRKGLFADVSKICEDMDININSANAKADSTGLCTMNFILSLSNTSSVEKIMTRFRQIKGVIDVYRTNY